MPLEASYHADGYRLGYGSAISAAKRRQHVCRAKARLDALGFIWDPHTAQWEEGFERLETFVKQHGHCRVPPLYVTPDGYRLGFWVGTQRRRSDRVPSERKARLNVLGFEWVPFGEAGGKRLLNGLRRL